MDKVEQRKCRRATGRWAGDRKNCMSNPTIRPDQRGLVNDSLCTEFPMPKQSTVTILLRLAATG